MVYGSVRQQRRKLCYTVGRVQKALEAVKKHHQGADSSDSDSTSDSQSFDPRAATQPRRRLRRLAAQVKCPNERLLTTQLLASQPVM